MRNPGIRFECRRSVPASPVDLSTNRTFPNLLADFMFYVATLRFEQAALLQGEQPPFERKPASVPHQFTAGADDAVARHDDGHGVGAIGRTHRPHGRRRPRVEASCRSCGFHHREF